MIAQVLLDPGHVEIEFADVLGFEPADLQFDYNEPGLNPIENSRWKKSRGRNFIDLPSSNGETVAKELGDRVRFAAGDVTTEADVAAALDVAESLGPLRVAGNCVGIGNAIKTVSKNGAFPLADFTKIVTVNLIGTFNVIRLAAGRISKNEPIEGERGVIINTASVAAYEGQIGQAAYSASKGGRRKWRRHFSRRLPIVFRSSRAATCLLRTATSSPSTTRITKALPPTGT